jgi:uncharacterized protein
LGTATAIKDDSIDGFVWSGGLPTGGVTDLFTSAGDRVEFLDIADLLPKLKEINPVYAEGTVPASAYKTPADVRTVVVPNLLLVRDDFPAGNACAITKLMFDRKADLEKVHPAAKDLDPPADRESRRRGVRTTRPERAVRACHDRCLVHRRVWTRGQWCAV